MNVRIAFGDRHILEWCGGIFFPFWAELELQRSVGVFQAALRLLIPTSVHLLPNEAYVFQNPNYYVPGLIIPTVCSAHL